MTGQRFMNLKKNPYINDKGIYIISTETLRKKNLFKVGYSGSSLKTRLGQIREVLTPALGEHLMVYGFVVPKSKKKSGVPQNVRAKELNQIERAVHKIYQDDGCRDVFVDSHNYSEWIYEDKLTDLYEIIKDIVEDPDSDYHINFKFVEL